MLASSSLAADRLLDEVEGAGLHGLNRHRHVAVAGHHDGWQPMARVVQPLEQFETAHPRQVGIDQETGVAARTIGLEECLACRVVLDRPAIVFEQRTHRVAQLVVVIDDENGRWARFARRFGDDSGLPAALRIATTEGVSGWLPSARAISPAC